MLSRRGQLGVVRGAYIQLWSSGKRSRFRDKFGRVKDFSNLGTGGNYLGAK